MRVGAQALKAFLRIVKEDDVLDIQIYPKPEPNGHELMGLRIEGTELAAQIREHEKGGDSVHRDGVEAKGTE